MVRQGPTPDHNRTKFLPSLNQEPPSHDAHRPLPRRCTGPTIALEPNCLRLILGFGVMAWRSGDQGADERGEQLFASLAGIVNKLEEPEIDRQLFL